MNPGDIVRCVDDRYSEGRLVKGRMYTVERVRHGQRGYPGTSAVPGNGIGVELYFTPGHPEADGNRWWKSTRFVPVNRKDLETEILAKVADKIMGGVK